jgi:phage anti-repressor protein
MEREEITLLEYNDILVQIANQENHLLLGNGFNRGLGVNTSYQSIFQKMMEKEGGIYQDAAKLVEDSGNDLETFIEKLEEDIDPTNTFLRKYVKNKVKFDFMQATHEIVKSEIKNIYAEKNEGVFLLLKNFNNYFTLNYDSLLYLLLLNFKVNDSMVETAIALQPTMKFIEDDININNTDIYKEIKAAREDGSLTINLGQDISSMKKELSKLTKIHFITELKEYSKSNNRNWKAKNIERVVNFILEEEKRNQVLKKVDDGATQLKLFNNKVEFVFDV